MKKVLFPIFCLFSFLQSFAQEGPDSRAYNIYSKYSFTSYDILSASKSVGWKPSQYGGFKGSFEYFEKVIISFTRQDLRALEQMRLTSCYQCSIIKNATYLLEKYNRIYKPVDMDTWVKKCPYLFTVMDIDSSITD